MADELRESTAYQRLRKLVIWLPAALIIILISLQSLNLYVKRRDVINNTQIRTTELTRILADHMDSSVVAADTSLKQLAIHGARVGGPTARAEAWLPILQAAVAGMSYIGSLTVTDENGIIRHSTVPALIGQSRHDDFLFKELSSNPNADLLADTPFLSPFHHQIIIPLGRRLTDSNGVFKGVVVATLIPEMFRDFYKTIGVDQGGIIWVIHSTGMVLFRHPSVAGATESSPGNAPLFYENIKRDDSGPLISRVDNDGPEYINAWQSLRQPPIVVAVSVNLTNPLGIWRRNAIIIILLTSLVVLILAGASFQVLKQIDGRISVERALFQREQELDEAQRIAGIASARFVLPGLVARASSQLSNLLGFSASREEISVDEVMEKLVEQDRGRLKSAFDSCVTSGTRYQLEVKTLADGGDERILWTEGAFTKAGDGQVASILAIFQDVTKQRQFEQKSAQSDRLAAIGRLTGGVAHDFNNLLTAIIGYSDLLMLKFKSNAAARAEIEEISKAGRRAADLTRQLLAFSRRQVLQPKIINLNRIITDLEKMLRRLIGEDIELIIGPHPSLELIKADPGQIEQILMNLAVNARDAMPYGGKLIIETHNVDLDESYAEGQSSAHSGRHVMLAVSDTGCGMDKETLDHIFEPFFTTKEQGKGTGLGLATVYGIVKQSGGQVRVYSEVGKGTTFKIHLPCTVESATKDNNAVASQPVKGSGSILVVEDDDSVRKLASRILNANGFTVLEANHPEKAISLYREHQGKIRLVITDVIMPGLSGRELYQQLMTIDGNIKVLYMSGYTDDAIVHLGVLEAKVPFVQKPFTPEVLMLKVHETLATTMSSTTAP
ncbi:MAG TPA: ATP-binding protein [Blastocatellia bacterium]|nr:ATP-binding protein [Blastocatellia bacterium]